MVTHRPARLTKSQVDRAAYRKAQNKQDIQWDPSLSGFGLRVYPSGKKAFVLSYRVNGRKHIMVLGPYGVLTVDQARAQALKVLGPIQEGQDPLETRRKAAQGETVQELAGVYIERYARPHKKTWKEDERRLQAHIQPAIGRLLVKSVQRSDVAALHNRIGRKHPYEANRVLELSAKMFELARQWGYLEAGAPNPARSIEPFKERKRDRWVKPEELPRLVEAIAQAQNPYVQAAIWLYLLTGMRRSELLKAKWTDIDWERRELRLGETKAGRTHYVPLTEPAIALLNQLPRQEGNPYLLPGHRKGAPLVNIDKPWRRVRKAADLEDVRLHDLRRTVGSWLAQSGNSLHLIGRVLNHSTPSTTAIYAHFAQDNVREALESHGRRLLEAAQARK